LEPDSQQDSLRDATNISLQLSVDGEKLSLGSLSLSSLEDSEKGLGNCDLEDTHKENEENKEAVDGSNGSHLECTLYNGVNQMDGLLARSIQNLPAKVPFLIKKRKRLIVFAVDSYDMLTGKLTTALLQLIQGALNAIKRSNTRSVGFLISTALTVSKTLSMLSENGIAVQDFDALICGSGSQLHYPAVSASREENYDLLYDHHIDYRWNKDGIRKTMPRLMLPDGEEVPSKGERALVEDEMQCNTHLLTYRVTKMAIVHHLTLSQSLHVTSLVVELCQILIPASMLLRIHFSLPLHPRLKYPGAGSIASLRVEGCQPVCTAQSSRHRFCCPFIY
jgi:sucrose-phosphate synthase